MAAVGHAQSMDLLDRLEIYIPVEAEVKTIPLWSLPNSVLRRMSLPLSDSEGSGKLAESPQGIWICPAVLRRKGQKLAPQTGKSATDNMSSLVATAVQAGTGPVRMSFVSSNRAAYKVLKDCMPGRKVSAETPLLPPGSALRTYHHAVIIYHGCIFLSIRKPKRKTVEPQPTSLSSFPSTSGVSSESRRKELLDINRLKKKPTTSTVTHSENRKDVTHQRRDVSSSKTACAVLQSADGVHRPDSRRQGDAGGEQPAAGPDPVCLQPRGEQEEMARCDGEIQNLGSEETESTNQNNVVGIIEQSSSQSWSSREYQGAACASTSLYPEFDYKELEHQEELNLIKAKLKMANDNLQKKKSE
ncbi:uncharacterized protein [Pempheris klunzingeri]|uniref:uncharacterized protein n=1 Tax=Pempheris klunzingeri TaxID=3127111 RepID=UPI003980D736